MAAVRKGPCASHVDDKVGGQFAADNRMAKRGRTPEVHTEHDSITFVMRVVVAEGYSSRLVLRCERTGGIFVSLRHPTPEKKE